MSDNPASSITVCEDDLAVAVCALEERIEGLHDKLHRLRRGSPAWRDAYSQLGRVEDTIERLRACLVRKPDRSDS